MGYDIEGEAQGCVNQLFYRNGPEAEDLKTTDATYVYETILRYMKDALEQGKRPLR